MAAAVATARDASALDVAFLGVIAQVFVYLAVATWTVTCIGLVRSLLRSARSRPRPAAAATAPPR